jgi:hypothetical protein
VEIASAIRGGAILAECMVLSAAHRVARFNVDVLNIRNGNDRS